MRISKENKYLLFFGLLLILVLSFIVNINIFFFTQNFNQIDHSNNIDRLNQDIEFIEIIAKPYEETIYENFDPTVVNIPDFISIEADNLVINPLKSNIGIHYIRNDSSKYYKIVVQLDDVDWNSLEREIKDFLGEKEVNYGIYIHDLIRDEKLEINSEKQFPPASISKLPSVVLTLKDIDEGKYTFEDTIQVKNSLKHTFDDSIGIYAQGTELPIKSFIDASILESNNSAHYHLHDNLGGLSIVNPRTQEELFADVFFLDPHLANARSVGSMLAKIYQGEVLSQDSTEYLFNLMKSTGLSLREGIPAGIDSNDVEIANKVGFLFGGIEGDVYEDSAIVFGEKTDYILVILNDNAPPFPFGSENLRGISNIVYKYLD